MAASSVPLPAASFSPAPASADPGTTRAPITRSGVVSAAGGPARPPSSPDQAPTAAPGPSAHAAAGAATAGSSFGETLAAVSAPASAKSVKGKSTNARAPKEPAPADAQSPGSASPAAQPLIAAASPAAQPLIARASPAAQPLAAGTLMAQAMPQGSSANPAAATDAGIGSSGPSADTAPANTTMAPTAAAGASSAHAAAMPAITASLSSPRGAPAPAVNGPASDEDGPDTGPALPQSGSSSSLPASVPAHAPLPVVPSATRTPEDGSQSSGTSSQPASSTSDLAGVNAALSAAAPGATAQAPGTSAPQTGAPVTMQVHAEVGSNGWANEVGARLHWMASQGIGSASLRLTPAQLGPVEVRISVHQNAASVWFSAAQSDTRSALEQSLPRLRELFSAQGLNLAQAGVSDQSARGAGQQQPQALGATALAAGVRELTATSVTSIARTHQGLIDTYV